jgi:hypothetical protein
MDGMPTSTIAPIRSLTDKEKRQALEALKEARALRQAILKRRKGKPTPSSAPLIRQAREEYTEGL